VEGASGWCPATRQHTQTKKLDASRETETNYPPYARALPYARGRDRRLPPPCARRGAVTRPRRVGCRGYGLCHEVALYAARLLRHRLGCDQSRGGPGRQPAGRLRKQPELAARILLVVADRLDSDPGCANRARPGPASGADPPELCVPKTHPYRSQALRLGNAVDDRTVSGKPRTVGPRFVLHYLPAPPRPENLPPSHLQRGWEGRL
jgi:hypothetical protein